MIDYDDVPNRPKVLLIGIDGVRYDVLRAQDAHHDGPDGGTPALRELRQSGSDVAVWMPADPSALTDSGPGWATLLTGTSPRTHGVRDNNFDGHRLARHPDLLTRARRAREDVTTFVAASWPPLVDAAAPGPVIRPGLHPTLIHDGDTHGYEHADALTAEVTAGVLSDRAPDLTFAYLGAVDEAGHAFGATGREYRDALRRTDSHVARMIASIGRRVAAGSAEDWHVVVTTDHGHLDEGGHGGLSEVERRSFAFFARVGPDGVRPALAPEVTELAPAALAGAVLGLLGVRE